MNRKERQEARANRLRELSVNAAKQSTEAYNQSYKMVEHIPPGQPILVGHHSERRHRSLLIRSWNALGKSVKLGEKAEYFERKAEAAENNNSIYLGDDDAVDRLQEKVDALEKAQGMMKAANKIVRSKKLNDIAKVEQLQTLGFSENKAIELTKPDRYGEYGFPSYMLSNNNARIRDAKQRRDRARKLKETEDKEYTISGVRVVENAKENRLQLFFAGIPSKEIRSQLKENNTFRWTPSIGCWQSYLNRWCIERAKVILNSITE
mgnify:FL=1